MSLRSVLEQEFGDWELIIKDGGSLPELLEEIPDDPRIRVIAQPDEGIFDAMNQALDHVRGDWVCFLNAGDFLRHRDVLSSVRDHAQIGGHSDFLYCDVMNPSSRSGFVMYPDTLSRAYLFSHMICHQAWFVRSAFYQQTAKYETREVSGSDRRFLLRMILAEKAAYRHVPEVLIAYKGGGVSERPDVQSRAEEWVDEMLRELYTHKQYRILKSRLRVKMLLKRWLYDTGAWRVLRFWRSVTALRN